jgi:tetratricopeptide (TPR) repeat protein
MSSFALLSRPWRRAAPAWALSALCISFASAALPAPSLAQGSGDLDSAARTLFEDGRRAFEGGDFETALARFQQAYDLSHRVPLLWNIATTLDRLRRDAEALSTFEQYLSAAPEASNRSEVEGRIRALREAIARDEAEAAARAETERQLEEERRRLEEERAAAAERAAAETAGGSIATLSPIAFIVGAGLTAVSAGVLVWSGVDTLTANDNYVLYTSSAGASVPDAERFYASALDAQLRTNVLVGVAAGLGVATVALAIFTDWDGDPAPAADSSGGAAPEARPAGPRRLEPTPSDEEAEGGADSAEMPAVSLLPAVEIGPEGGVFGVRGAF